MQRQHQTPHPSSVAMLAQGDPLPGAERELTIADRDHDTAAEQRGLHVGGHVIRPLIRVFVRKRLRGQLLEHRFEVGPHLGIGVLMKN